MVMILVKTVGAELVYNYRDKRNTDVDIPGTFLETYWILLWVYTHHNLCN